MRLCPRGRRARFEMPMPADRKSADARLSEQHDFPRRGSASPSSISPEQVAFGVRHVEKKADRGNPCSPRLTAEKIET